MKKISLIVAIIAIATLSAIHGIAEKNTNESREALEMALFEDMMSEQSHDPFHYDVEGEAAMRAECARIAACRYPTAP